MVLGLTGGQDERGDPMTTTTEAPVGADPGAITVTKQSGVIGAIITGLDLSKPMDDATYDLLHEAILEHCVICIRGQAAMTSENQLEYANRWGEVAVHPYVPSIEGYPGVMKIYDPNPITQTWHSDTTHAERPPSLTILLARTIPPFGGDTMWANAYSAYEGLSDGMKETLAPLRAVHQGTALAADAGLDAEAVKSVHPVIRTHPETGRKALFVNGNYVVSFEGWSVEDSAPLLQYLYRQFEKPEYQYRHHWQEGDLVMWDNRSTQHSVVGDTAGAERVLHRITIRGDVPK
jgi:taurine dioxygenase